MKETDLSLAETQHRFDEYYQQKLRPVFEKFEEERQAGLKTLGRILIIILLIAALFYFFASLDIVPDGIIKKWVFWPLWGLMFIMITFRLITFPNDKYCRAVKSRIMSTVISFWGKFKYCGKENIIGTKVLKKSELFGDFNASEVDDAFSGEYHDVALAVSENKLYIHGKKQDISVFRGILLLLDFPKTFEGQITVLHKGRNIDYILNNPLHIIAIALAVVLSLLPYYVLSAAGNAPFGIAVSLIFIIMLLGSYYFSLMHHNPQKATKKVVLEGLPFMKNWRILTDNQVAARYVLTPVFMEKMLEIKRLFHGRHIDFAFFDSKLLMAVHTRKNMFETTSLFVPASNNQKIGEVVKQLHGIFSVINVVSGNNH